MVNLESEEFMKGKYRWMSLATGEVQENIIGVIKTIYADFKDLHKLWLNWEYRRSGF